MNSCTPLCNLYCCLSRNLFILQNWNSAPIHINSHCIPCFKSLQSSFQFCLYEINFPSFLAHIESHCCFMCGWFISLSIICSSFAYKILETLSLLEFNDILLCILNILLFIHSLEDSWVASTCCYSAIMSRMHKIWDYAFNSLEYVSRSKTDLYHVRFPIIIMKMFWIW